MRNAVQIVQDFWGLILPQLNCTAKDQEETWGREREGDDMLLRAPGWNHTQAAAARILHQYTGCMLLLENISG